VKRSEAPLQVGTEGLELFARASDPETSHQAAASMRDHAGAQRQAILEYLLAHPEGATADDLDQALLWRPSTAGRRLGELLGQKGEYVVVRLDGEYDPKPPLLVTRVPKVTRETRQGRQGFVHVHRVHLSRACDTRPA